MAEKVIIALEPLDVQQVEEILIEDDAARALEFIQKIVKPQIDKEAHSGGKGFFDENPEPFFE